MIGALILAGGRATRMGGVDKALLELGGEPILSLLLRRLRPQAGLIALSANGDPARYAGFGLPILPDDLQGRGPLAGVLRGLAWAEASGAGALLTVPGDTPFIPPDLAARLSPAPGWAETAAGLHPLIALWPTGCRAALAAWLAGQPSGRVRSFGERIGMRPVWFDEAPDPFFNINTQADLAAARGRVL